MTAGTIRFTSFTLFAALVVLGACRHTPPPAKAKAQTRPEQEILLRLAGVERIEPVVLESQPVQVRVLVYGWLPDGCTTLHGFDQTTERNLIKMRILTVRPKAAMCTQAIKRFQETYPVEIEGLPSGTYTLDVNGKTAQFTLP